MPFQKGENPNHPYRGAAIKVEPIRYKKAIKNIKKILADRPRDLCLFTLGINTAFRASELLSIRYGQVRLLDVGETLEIKQPKTKRYRMVTLNRTCIEALDNYINNKWGRSFFSKNDFIFYSQRGSVLTVPTVTNMVKKWCLEVGLEGNYGSHTLRKTWGYWQYQHGTQVALLMEAFKHSTQRQTLDYLCIQDKEIQNIFNLEL
ncbi:MAG: tyrosine-type recombinase/integrase [Prochloraceae cyanobacterium]|nr:tyrosine-type recombinase/integrase [Prochloraceae cyanobacterium]